MNLKRPNLRGAGLGSRLKASELKPPDSLADFYYDLRDRRLLPVIALVVVAIAAVPFLLGDDGEGPRIAAPAPEAGGSVGGAADGAQLTVVESTPGLRDYRKRLRGAPTDPFVQQYTSVPSTSQLKSTTASSASSGASEVSVTEGVEETGETTESAPSGAGGGSDGGTSPGSGGADGGATQTYELVIDTQITRTETTADGDEKRGETEVRKNVPVLTQLPGKKTPVVTTAGANVETARLVFLVSHEVKAISGEFACITRGKICELLEVELGILVEYVYEPSGAHYEIKVTGVDAIPARKRKTGTGQRSSRAAFAQAYPGMAWIGQNFSK